MTGVFGDVLMDNETRCNVLSTFPSLLANLFPLFHYSVSSGCAVIALLFLL